MKVKQVVGEHKKGFRAKKYASKPKPYIEPHKPKAPDEQKTQQIKEAPGDAELFNQVDALAKSNPKFAAELKSMNLFLVKGITPEAQKHNARVMQQYRLLVQKYSGTPVQEELPGQMVGKVQQVKPDGTVDIQKPSGDTTTVQATALQPGDNNKLTIQTPKIQPGMQVDAEKTIEEQPDDAGLVKHYAAQLQALLPKATQPWEQAQIQARIKAATKDGWIPRNPDGSPIAVLPPKEWEAKTDPQTVLKINGVNGPGLSPEFKQKMGGAVSQGIMKYTGFEESADNKLLDKMLTIAGLR